MSYGNQAVTIRLIRRDSSVPWGFRMSGGIDFGQPLTITQVKVNSPSFRHGIEAGSRLVAIGGDSTSYMTHQQVSQCKVNND